MPTALRDDLDSIVAVVRCRDRLYAGKVDLRIEFGDDFLPIVVVAGGVEESLVRADPRVVLEEAGRLVGRTDHGYHGLQRRGDCHAD